MLISDVTNGVIPNCATRAAKRSTHAESEIQFSKFG